MTDFWLKTRYLILVPIWGLVLVAATFFIFGGIDLVRLLAVNFMGAIFVGNTDDLLQYGAGIAPPIAVLGVFVGLRAWSSKVTKETEKHTLNRQPARAGKTQVQENWGDEQT